MLSDDQYATVAQVCIVLVAAWVLYAVVAVILSYITSQWWPAIDFRNKRVFVTGGSTGIGLEMAKSFAAKGAKVIISARREDVLRSAVAEINLHANMAATKKGVQVFPAAFVTMDVSDENAVEAGLAAAQKLFDGTATQDEVIKGAESGSVRRRRNSVSTKTPLTPANAAAASSSQPIDLLVCNAGYSYPARFLDIPSAEARRQMDINFFGCINVIRGALPSMLSFHEQNPRSPPSRIVCISSLAAIVPAAGFTIYAPTKAALVAFCHSLDMESSSKGVRAQVVYPPDVATPGLDKENEVKSEECKKICEGSPPFTAAQMGNAIADSLEAGGGFTITLGFDGWLLARLGSMMQPNTFLFGALELLGVATVARAVGCVFSKVHYGIVKGVSRKERRQKLQAKKEQ